MGIGEGIGGIGLAMQYLVKLFVVLQGLTVRSNWQGA
jgi:hypothetical protein